MICLLPEQLTMPDCTAAIGQLRETHPLMMCIPSDDYVTVYDARAHFALNLSHGQFAALCSRLGCAAAGPAPPDRTGGLDRLLEAGLFQPGPFEKTYSTDESELRTYILDYQQNVVTRKFCLEVTERCNFRCRYCPYTIGAGVRRHSTREMTLETARKAIDRYFERYAAQYSSLGARAREVMLTHAPPNLSWYGGECLLRFDLVRDSQQYFAALPWARSGIPAERLSYIINTNLSIANDEIFRFLVTHNVQTHVSLDGSEEQNDRYRIGDNGGGTFDAVYRNLQRLRQFDERFYRTRVAVLATTCPGHNQEECAAFLATLGARVSHGEMQVPGKLTPDPRAYMALLEGEQRRTVELLEDACSAGDAAILRERIGEHESLRRGIESVRKTFASLQTDLPVEATFPLGMRNCPMAFDVLQVSVDGGYHMCQKSDGSMPLGDCDRGHDIEAIAAAYRKFHLLLNRRQCRGCWAIRFCNVCAAPVMRDGGFIEPCEEDCECIRRGAAASFSLFQAMSRHGELLARAADVSGAGAHNGVLDLATIRAEASRIQKEEQHGKKEEVPA